MRRIYLLNLIALLLAGAAGCDNTNQKNARYVNSLVVAGSTDLSQRNAVQEWVKLGFEFNLVGVDLEGETLIAEDMEIEVEVRDVWNATNSCVNHPYGENYWVRPGEPCFNLWVFNHRGNSGPSEGRVNGQPVTGPVTFVSQKTNKQGRAKFSLFWEHIGDLPVDHRGAADILILARVVRQNQTTPQFARIVHMDFGLMGKWGEYRTEIPYPVPAFSPKPKRLSLNCPSITSWQDSDGDGFPDELDDCPGSWQGPAGLCGCDQPIEDADLDWYFTCPLLAVQPPGADEYPDNPNCHSSPCAANPDLDADGDVDQDDFGRLQRCLGSTSLSSPCEPSDLNLDGLVNSEDVAVMAGCRSRPGLAWNPACLP